MRWGVVSDIHGNLPALRSVSDAMDAAGVEGVINLGDLLSGPLWPAETARWLMDREARGLAGQGPRWHTIAGNHERQLLDRPTERMAASDAFAARHLPAEARAWLQALPAEACWPDWRLAACHGRPGDDLRYLLETVLPAYGRPGLPSSAAPGIRAATDAELRERLRAAPACDLLLCGHSHQPRLLAVDGRLLLNPGSVGLPAFDDAHEAPHWVETGTPWARWALIERAGSEAPWQVALQATPYAHGEAVHRALANGRPDWADALGSGRVGRRESDLAPT